MEFRKKVQITHWKTEKKRTKTERKNGNKIKTANLSPYGSIITLNINCLNIPIKDRD